MEQTKIKAHLSPAKPTQLDLQTQFEMEVPFHDVDSMHIVWHGHYWKYFELARTQWFRSINYDYPEMDRTGFVWPVTDCQCRYIKPMTYGMKIRIVISLLEYEFRIKLGYLVHDMTSGKKICKASTIQVPINWKTKEMCMGSPDILLERLGLK